MAGFSLLWSVPTAASRPDFLPHSGPLRGRAGLGRRRRAPSTLPSVAAAMPRFCGDSGLRVLGIDRDPDALAAARRRLGTEGIGYLEGSLCCPAALAASCSPSTPIASCWTLGVSSRIKSDTAERGFTFRPGAPLDMRMQASGLGSRDKGIAARDVLNSWPEERLTQVFSDYGDERARARLARQVIRPPAARAASVISDDFVNAIERCRDHARGSPTLRGCFSSAAHRCQRRVRVARASAAAPARDALVPGRSVWRDRLPTRARPDREARVPRMGPRLHAARRASPSVHVPRHTRLGRVLTKSR